VDRLSRKFEHIGQRVPKPRVEINENARIGLVCCGTSRDATKESRDQLRREYRVETSYLRLLAYPFSDELTDFIRRHDRVYVVDQNRDGQLFLLMKLDLSAEEISKLKSVRYYGGMPIDARTVTDEILKQEGM
jgi:2-oxoglutarate ferredoxin oxidoreductase subunit alpha